MQAFAIYGEPGFRSLKISNDDANGSSPEEPLPHFLNRHGEEGVSFFRCDRFFYVGHDCFVTVRNGEELGPFPGRNEAEVALVRYVAEDLRTCPDELAVFCSRPKRPIDSFESLVREVLDFKETLQLRSANSAYVWVMQQMDGSERQDQTDDVRGSLFASLRDELDDENMGQLNWVD